MFVGIPDLDEDRIQLVRGVLCQDGWDGDVCVKKSGRTERDWQA